jgi:hypothetical protein
MDLDDIDLDTFVQASRAAMLFSFPGPSLKAQMPDDIDTHTFVTRLMQRKFLRSATAGETPLLVHRPEIDNLASSLRSHRVSTLIGERGAGKSTILFGALSQLGALSHELLEQFGIDDPDASSAADSDILLVLYNANFTYRDSTEVLTRTDPAFLDRVYSSLLRSSSSPEMARKWEIWRITNLDFYADFHAALSSHTNEPLTLETWIGVGSLPSILSASWTEADRKFQQSEPLDRCLAIIQHLGLNLDKRIIIALDNVDHLPTEVQVAMVESLVLLRRRSPTNFGAVTVLRPESEAAIVPLLTGDAQSDVLRFERLKLADRDFEIIGEVITRRMLVLVSQEFIAFVNRDDERLKQFTELVISSTIGLIQNFFTFGRSRDSINLENEEYVGYFVDWYNGSIRFISISLVDFVTNLVRDVNLAFTLKLWVAGVSNIDSKKERRLRQLLRTGILYHLVDHTCRGMSTLTAPLPPNVLLLEPAVQSASTNPQFPFLFVRLRVLQRIFTAHGEGQESIKVRQIVREFREKFNARPELVVSSIADLAYPRFADDSGLIRVNDLAHLNLGRKPISEVATMITEDMSVELLPAGRLLVSHLVYTCEYLYRALVSGPYFSEFKGGNVEVEASIRDFRNSIQRVRGASYYLEKVLLNAFSAEHPYLTRSSDEPVREADKLRRLEAFQLMFGFRQHDWMLTRAAKGIRKHAGGSLDRDEFRDAREALHHVETFCASLDRVAARIPARDERR